MSPEVSLETRVHKILSDLTAIPPEKIHPQDRLREDLGLDSVGSMELLSMLAEEFDIQVEMEEAMEATSVELVVSLARDRLARAS